MGMSKRRAWGMAVLLAAVLLGSGALVAARLRPYWIARYRGEKAQLHGAWLPRAPLEGIILIAAELSGANLSGSNLRGAYLEGADLRNANLRGAQLQKGM